MPSGTGVWEEGIRVKELKLLYFVRVGEGLPDHDILPMCVLHRPVGPPSTSTKWTPPLRGGPTPVGPPSPPYGGKGGEAAGLIKGEPTNRGSLGGDRIQGSPLESTVR